MVHKLSLQILRFHLTCTSALCLFPLNWKLTMTTKKLTVTRSPNRLRVWYAWIIISGLLSIQSVCRFWFLMYHGSESIMFLMIHMIMLSHTLGRSLFFVISVHSMKQFCHLFNVLHSFGSKEVREWKRLKYLPKNFKLNDTADLFVSVTCFLTFVAVPITLPLQTFVFPCRQLSTGFLGEMYPAICSKWGLQVIFYIIEMILLFEGYSMGCPLVILCTMCVSTLNQHLKIAKRIGVRGVLFYRQIQVFTIILNTFCQHILLPTCQIIGSIVIISSMYSVIEYKDHLPPIMLLISGGFLFLLSAFLSQFFDVASRSLVVSKSLLKAYKSVTPTGCSRSGWLTKYCRSCQLIKIYMGPFHVVDKGRVPALFRFCLQRTIFLVVRARSTGQN